MQTLTNIQPRTSATLLDPTAHSRRRDTFGVASLDQLLRAGFSRPQLDALERRHAIVRVHDGVYRTAATVLTPRRRLLAVCLAIGGVVAASDRAGLWLWDLTDHEPPVEVTTPASPRRPLDGAVVHVRADLAPSQISVHRGVPVTSPARTLADVGCLVDRDVLATAVDKALYLHLVTLQQLRGLVGVAEGAPNAGIAALDAVLGHRVHGF